ncbi:MAG TPA: PucR family transcriptional regulator ligand-binding domain-containing protein [Solirubrobacteraceae bacterium]|jgi:purine catabolism regulator|nr:PucR family transcriptional regulator ligand-binding domain-containing protein [Solirubrobacteraceae bacterium]
MAGFLTVERLIDEVGLGLASGAESGGARVRWVHSTELVDPTPWLIGGELVLSTGAQLGGAEAQRDYVRRLVDHRIAGLGFGTGFAHDQLPQALLAAAREAAFPVFEVPYALPFIAITERAFAHLVNDQFDGLRRSMEIQARLERLVLDERGLACVVASVAAEIGGSVGVLNGRGDTLAWHDAGDPAAADVHRAAIRLAIDRVDGHPPEHIEPDGSSGRALGLPVVATGGGRPQAWLVGVGSLDEFERLVLRQTVTVVALELMRLRLVRDTERRLAGDVFAEALTGRLHPEELEARLRPFGLGHDVAVLAFAVRDPAAAEPVLDRALDRLDVPALVATRGALVCAVVDTSDADPIDLARRVRRDLTGELGDVRAAASRTGTPQALRRSFHEARCALEAVRHANGGGPDVASHKDLGAFHLLLSLQDDDALRSYSESVLGPLSGGQPGYGEELLRSVDVFLEHNGHWENAAAELFCHRHTLRYRLRRVERLTGRDLASTRDRIEFWLALRGRELAR